MHLSFVLVKCFLKCSTAPAIFQNSKKSSCATSTTGVSLVFVVEWRNRRKHLGGSDANCLVCS